MAVMIGDRAIHLVDRDVELVIERIHVDASGCWLWMGRRDRDGYGVVNMPKRGDRKQSIHMAHRISYQIWKADVRRGLTLDHLCRVRHCVNPDHLEEVTNRVNILRGDGPPGRHSRTTHCPSGHPYAGENLGITVDRLGRRSRFCRACRHEAQARWRRAHREQISAYHRAHYRRLRDQAQVEVETGA